ncbi:MAG: type II CRISPR-associated endonuclease Cas1 [Saccharofermentans sp.]|nr:type II CRISPR-associated endonuclease Cas1 [Saccharofermentans sp.]
MWRSVIVYNGEKISVESESLVISMENGITKKIPLEDLYCVVIDNRMLTITVPAMTAFAKYKVHVVFTDEHHLPVAMSYPINNNYRSYGILKKQLSMTRDFKGEIWKLITTAKIYNQATTLENVWCDREIVSKMKKYASEVEPDDLGCREAIAAKLFFRNMYGSSFVRFEDDAINIVLNYGYAIIRSAVAKSLVAHGFNCVMGVHHISETNEFNLADDFMEPLRPMVDHWVEANMDFIEEGLSKTVKNELVNLVNQEMLFDGKKMKVRYAIDSMIKTFVSAVENGVPEKLVLPEVIYHHEK